MSSKEISELTGKEHKHVIRDIQVMLEALKDGPNLDHVEILREHRGYIASILLPKDLTITLVTGYNVVMRHRIVTRWQELEAQVAAPVASLPNFNNPAEAARAWASLHVNNFGRVNVVGFLPPAGPALQIGLDTNQPFAHDHGPRIVNLCPGYEVVAITRVMHQVEAGQRFPLA